MKPPIPNIIQHATPPIKGNAFLVVTVVVIIIAAATFFIYSKRKTTNEKTS